MSIMAKLVLLKGFLVFQLTFLYCIVSVDSLYKVESGEINAHQISMRIDESLHGRHSIKKREIHRLSKRSAVGQGDSKCAEQDSVFQQKLHSNNDFMHDKFTFDNETSPNLALTWLGVNSGVLLVVTTEEHFIFVKPSKVYLSEDNGKSFKDISERVEHAYIKQLNGLQKHRHEHDSVFLVAYGEHNGFLWISNDKAKTFRKAPLNFNLHDELSFYHKDPKWILARDYKNHTLCLSKDGGFTWKAIKDHVQGYKWSTWDEDLPGTIYALVDPNPSLYSSIFGRASGKFNLEKTTKFGESWIKLKTNVHTFGMEGKFLFTTTVIGKNQDERLMEVSTFGGAQFTQVQLPTLTDDRFYSILDMSEGMVFMHVDDPGDSGHGTLYTSDATGIVFSESLLRHLYPNNGGQTDFYKVQSMRGTYLASQLGDDNSVHTVISHDRGGEWKSLPRPKGVPCKDETKGCFLQIHNAFSVSRHVRAQSPLTVNNTVGLIIVHGHVAEALQTTDPDVYVSSDGGYTFRKALDGPHHYQIADQGGLLVAVPMDTSTPNTIKFSTDEGRCWNTYQFTNESIIFTRLLTEPGNKEMTVAIWGYGSITHQWVAHVIDFRKVIDRACDKNDYETWTAHGDNSRDDEQKGCLLGCKETFDRLKLDSWCYNGHANEITNGVRTSCKCTKDDYDCDYGYHRNTNSENCILDRHFKGAALDICVRGHEEQIVTVGYHKIPGDQCSGGFSPPGDETRDLKKTCSESDRPDIMLSGGYVSEEADGSVHVKSGVVIFIVVLAAVLVSIILIVFLGRRYIRLRRQQHLFVYSSLYTEENEAGTTTGGNTGLYDESSDEDAPIIAQGKQQDNKPQSNGAITHLEGIASPLDITRPSPGRHVLKNQSKHKSYHDSSDEDMLE